MARSKIVQEILALPPEDRLPYALEMIDSLTGQDSHVEIFLKARYKFTRQEAQLFATLNNMVPRVATKENLYNALYGGLGEVEMKIIDVFVCKIRKKLIDAGSDVKIETVWGQGYRLQERIDIPNPTDSVSEPENDRKSSQWTEQDDEDLERMYTRGDHLPIIAYELERTERAILDRVRLKGLKQD